MALVAALLFMMIGTGIWAYDTPAYFVSVDVNPGLTMEVNMFKHVIGLDYSDDEAEALLGDLDRKDKNIEHVIAEIIARLTEAGYFDNDGNIVIAAAAKDEQRAEILAGKFLEVAEDEAEKNDAQPEVVAEGLGYFMVQEAKELGITPGRLNIITNLLGEEVNDENINEPIRDLMARFTATKGREGKTIKEQAGKPEGAGKPGNEDDSEEPGKSEGVGKLEDADKLEGVGKRCR